MARRRKLLYPRKIKRIKRASSIEKFKKDYTNLDNPYAFGGPAAVSRSTGIPLKEVKNKLPHVYSYGLHREYHKPQHFNPFFMYFKRQQVQVDLIDISSYSGYNDDVTFLLTVIDCFTKKVWVKPLKNKQAVTTRDALEIVFNDMEDLPKSVFFDRGSEFRNKLVTTLLNKHNIKIFHPRTDIKAAIIERFNRSIQSLIFKFMTEKQSSRYIDHLDDIVEVYNKRGHRTLKYMSPDEAELEENWAFVREALNEKYSKIVHLKKKKKPKYSLGDVVRLKLEKRVFARGYHEQFKRELFKIIKINTRLPVIQYELQSLNDDVIMEKSFYENELSEFKGSEYLIEQVLDKRTNNRGKEELLVKWLDFDDEHNEWIPSTAITRDFRLNTQNVLRKIGG